MNNHGGERQWRGRDEHLARIAVRGGITHAQLTARGAVNGVDPAVDKLFRVILDEIVGDISSYAKRAGISRSTLAKWRQGKRDPKLSIFRAAANAAGYDLRIVKMEEKP